GKADTPPYDPNSATADAYQGDSGAVVRQIGPGVSVKVNVTGDDVLSSLLPAMRALSGHLAANDSASLQTTDLQAIDAGLTAITSARSQVGATTNRVGAAGTQIGRASCRGRVES